MELTDAGPEDAPELLVLQRCCWVQEALLNDTLDIPALHESLEDVRDWTKTWSVWLLRAGHRLIGAVRARLDGDCWEVGRLMVAPDFAGRGLGRQLLAHAEAQAPAGARRFALFTGARSTRNITMYQRAGYRLTEPPAAGGHIRGAVYLEKDVTLREKSGPAA
ncbi:GNAT family N-acetyltransferase [Amycolatopsis vancoresmycina]|uniref:tRNA (Guanine-N1-)-methyltransferase/acyltransferase n=1 Tax=Amycolatopsis vancoresmycina DSM 44592 TaxID=1292037 RepID=R1I1W7_9PSEU|nr:GNAT family N-acetyltransferase [Amycolatopsis vancoresmycina]EOD69820.1 tRNA (guanine-N1-)-methyltransferase/acyltransferase [Amycolatopsis vancoresmycina DSM 44592]